MLDILQGIHASGFSLSRGLEHSRQWHKVSTVGPVGPLVNVTLGNPHFESLFNWAIHLLAMLDTLAHKVVSDRKITPLCLDRLDNEDHSAHRYRWLRADHVPLLRLSWFAVLTRPLANVVFWLILERLTPDSSRPGYHSSPGQPEDMLTWMNFWQSRWGALHSMPAEASSAVIGEKGKIQYAVMRVSRNGAPVSGNKG